MATRALLIDLININNMCGGRMTVEEALRFKRLEDTTFDEEYRMMSTNPYENQPRESGFGEWPSYDESGVRFDADSIDVLHNDVLPFLEELCNAFEEAE